MSQIVMIFYYFFFCSHVSVERTSEQMVMEQRLMHYRETGGGVVVTRQEERIHFTKNGVWKQRKGRYLQDAGCGFGVTVEILAYEILQKKL